MCGHGPLYITSRVLVEGKSSVCATSMKYKKMILIIIIISLGQILLLYIANTSRTRAHAHTHPLPSLFDGPVRQTMMELTPPFRCWRYNGRSVHHSNKQHAGNSVFAIVLGGFRVKEKILVKLRRALMTECTVNRYEQFETSPETIEQELRPAIC